MHRQHSLVGAATGAMPQLEVWGTRGGPGSRHGIDKIKFMYAPFLETIRLGASHLLGASHVRVRYAWHKRPNFAPLRNLSRGDAFVWIGFFLKDQVPWAMLRKQGVFAVYYQTEPLAGTEGFCDLRWTFNRSVVDEVWDYSHHNIDQCRDSKDAPVMRYVPPGVLPTDARATQTAQPPTLVFFGAHSTPQHPTP